MKNIKNDKVALFDKFNIFHHKKWEEKIWTLVFKTTVILVIFIIALMLLLLLNMALPAIKHFGPQFISSTVWNPVEEVFGAWPFIYGTLVTSFLALILALPFGILSAIFITELCPYKIKKIFILMIDLTAAIPSIVFGMWGLFFLAPFVRDQVAPWLEKYLGFIPLFKGPCFGISILTASLVLGVMIVPTISSLSRELFASMPATYKEAALAIGATNFEKIKIAILRPSWIGIVGTASLGLARAVGETMAVVMVIGNTPKVALSLFSPAATMASVLANEYTEARSGLHLSSLCYIAILLFIITFLISSVGRILIRWLATKAI